MVPVAEADQYQPVRRLPGLCHGFGNACDDIAAPAKPLNEVIGKLPKRALAWSITASMSAVSPTVVV